MNKEYFYRTNDVLVNTDNGIFVRKYVNNFDDILKVENNIDILETRIKCLEYTINRLMSLRKSGKAIVIALMSFGIFISLTTICATGFIIPTLLFAGIEIGVCAFASLLCYLPFVVEGATKKKIRNLESRIPVYKYELEQEKNFLSELKQKSEKINIPKCKNNKGIGVPRNYQIKNLKTKLNIIYKFNKVPNLFIDEYNNGTIDEVLGDLGCTNMEEGIRLVKYLIDEYQKGQNEKQNGKKKTKRKNK